MPVHLGLFRDWQQHQVFVEALVSTVPKQMSYPQYSKGSGQLIMRQPYSVPLLLKLTLRNHVVCLLCLTSERLYTRHLHVTLLAALSVTRHSVYLFAYGHTSPYSHNLCQTFCSLLYALPIMQPLLMSWFPSLKAKEHLDFRVATRVIPQVSIYLSHVTSY